MADSKPDTEDPRLARTRQSALDATLELIAESGLQGCTIETVSKRSGIASSTLYRHWNNKSELIMDALKSQVIERVAPDTGNLRDDMLTAMLELGRELQHSTWGAVVAQLMAAATIDPEMDQLQQAHSDYHLGIDIKSLERAIERGEVDKDVDPEHAALMFSAPIFYRHLYARQHMEPRWITTHVDQTVAHLHPH